MAQSDQVQNLVNNLTSAAPSGPPQARSMSDLLAVTGWSAASAGGGGGAGGKYEFSPNDLQALIKEWQDLHFALQEAHSLGETMAGVTSPADEDASKGFAKKATDSGQAYLRHNHEMRDYVTAYIGKLQDTLDSYTKAEQASADHARRIQNNR